MSAARRDGAYCVPIECVYHVVRGEFLSFRNDATATAVLLPADAPMLMADTPITILVRSVDRAYQGPAWHGPTLMSALRGVTPEQAAWRPQPDRHNVWELLVHCAYWKYRVCAPLTDLPRGSFELKGSNFFERPVEMTREAWDADLRLLQGWHDLLLDAIQSFDAARLHERVGKTRFTYEHLIDGAGAHDVYHAGQIQLIKKMREAEVLDP